MICYQIWWRVVDGRGKVDWSTQSSAEGVVLQVVSSLSPSSIIWYQRKLGSKQAYRVVHQPVSRGLAVFADAWLSGWLAEISADLRGAVSH